MPNLARTLIPSTVLAGVLLVALVSACAGDEEEGPVARPARPLPGASSPTPAQGDTTPTQALTNNGKCEELGSLTATTTDAKYVSDEVRSLSLPLANRPVASKVAVVAVGTRTALLGTDAALGAAENANYETCTHCLVIAVGCTTDCTAGTWFYPRSGKATFSAVPNVAGDEFKGTFTDVTLEEVRIDFSTGLSTPVPSGACFHVNSLSFDATAKSATTGTSTSSTSTSSGGSTSSTSSGSTSSTTSSGGSTTSSSGSTTSSSSGSTTSSSGTTTSSTSSGSTSTSSGSTSTSSGSTTSSSGTTTSSSGTTGTSSGSGGGGKGADSLKTKVAI